MKMSKTTTLAIIAIGFLIATMSFVANKSFFRGTNKYVTQNLKVENFTEVSVRAGLEVQLKEGDYAPLEIEGDKDLLDRLIVEVVDGKLILDMKKGFFSSYKKGLTITVSAPLYNAISVSGSGNVANITELKNGTNLTLGVSGSGDLNLYFNNKESINSKVSGSGDMVLKGNANNSIVKVSGSGSFDGSQLVSQVAEVGVSGSGDAKVKSTKSIKARCSGSGSIYYDCDGEVEKSKSGSGSIDKRSF